MNAATMFDFPAIFRVLADMYLTPPSSGTIEAWMRMLTGGEGEAVESLKEALYEINLANPEEIAGLQTEYARLFVGPASLPCPPWESMYSSPDRRMMQDAHDQVLALYHEAGAEMNDSGILADHIGAELRFLALLLDRTGENDERANDAFILADRLLDEHLNKWQAVFTADLERAARVPFYRALARSTRTMLAVLQE